MARQTAPAKSTNQAGESPLKVFILAGQSNMEGQAVADPEGEYYNGGQGAMPFEVAGGHPRVAGDPRQVLEPLLLALACGDHLLSHRG